MGPGLRLAVKKALMGKVCRRCAVLVVMGKKNLGSLCTIQKLDIKDN